ncbi:hypothetical protein O6H91_20G054700 [Diphasiastrum complanatum]|uniref:Uncharacterized protein n=1 Tax=Diphasiastrum complanatum TaxID=34168 RepID=A0ACC2AQB3_DIPCM|nr:hypothetical protein O6H91_20G054700 [Diphasiastrum complanatum]
MAMPSALLLLRQQQPTSSPFCCSCSCSSSRAAIAAARHGNSLLFMRSQLCTSLKSKKQAFKLIERLKVAEDDNNNSDISSSVESALTSAPVDKKAQVKAVKEKGQATAIVTGVIAVLLGLGYLLVVQLLDTRGVILIPPPPEAFEP